MAPRCSGARRRQGARGAGGAAGSGGRAPGRESEGEGRGEGKGTEVGHRTAESGLMAEGGGGSGDAYAQAYAQGLPQQHQQAAYAPLAREPQGQQQQGEQAMPPGGGDMVSREIECPPSVVGRVIGKGGEVIRAIQNITGVRVFLNQDLPPEQNRIVSVTGQRAGVEQAEQLVHEVMEQGARGASNVLARAAGPTHQTVDCPKHSIGRVIGRQGTTIKALQTVSGARVQIDQSTEPCKITINGYDNNVRHAADLIDEVLQGAPVDQLEQQANMIQSGLVPPPSAMPGPYDYGAAAAYPGTAAAPTAAGYPPAAADPYTAAQMQQYGQVPPQAAAAGQYGQYAATAAAYPSGWGAAYPYAPAQSTAQPTQQGAPQNAQHQQSVPHQPQQQQQQQEWFSAVDPASGRTYYYNIRTQVSQWQPPMQEQ